jgi:hypothetical protein
MLIASFHVTVTSNGTNIPGRYMSFFKSIAAVSVLTACLWGCRSDQQHPANELSAEDRAALERIKSNEVAPEVKAELARAKANEITPQEREVLERAKAREAARATLSTTPDHFILGTNPLKQERGFINTYTKVVSIEFANSSEFDVSEITGHITFTGANGKELGTIPFTANGDVNAGATTTLSVSSGEVTGKVANSEIAVETVHIRG